jgi:low affinity Fe/Cu permease
VNTATTVLTFLMIALLHNSQRRFETATNQRLQRIVESIGAEDPAEDEGQQA